MLLHVRVHVHVPKTESCVRSSASLDVCCADSALVRVLCRQCLVRVLCRQCLIRVLCRQCLVRVLCRQCLVCVRMCAVLSTCAYVCSAKYVCVCVQCLVRVRMCAVLSAYPPPHRYYTHQL